MNDFKFHDLDKAIAFQAIISAITSAGALSSISQTDRTELSALLCASCGNELRDLQKFKEALMDGLLFGDMDFEMSCNLRQRLKADKNTLEAEAEHIIETLAVPFIINDFEKSVEKLIQNHHKMDLIQTDALASAVSHYHDLIDTVEFCDKLKALSPLDRLKLVKGYELTELLPTSPDQVISPYALAKAAVQLELTGKGEAFSKELDRLSSTNAARGI